MKKTLILVFAMLMSLGLVACAMATQTTTQATADTTSSSVNVANQDVTYADQQFALEAVSAFSMLSSSTATNVALTEKYGSNSQNPRIINSLTDINDYLKLIDTFLSGDKPLTITTAASTMDGYDYMVTYQTTDLAGNVETYTLYFNATLYSTSTDGSGDTTTTTTTDNPVTTTSGDTTTAATTDTTTATTTDTTTATTTDTQATTTDTTTAETTNPVAYRSNDGTHPLVFDDSDDSGLTYLVSGILVFGDTTYNVEGKEIQSDTSTALRLYAYTDNQNFVRVNSNETTTGMTRYNYQLVQNGTLVTERDIMVTTQDNVTHVRLDLVQDGTEVTLNFTEFSNTDGSSYIMIKYQMSDSTGVLESGHVKIYATVDSTTGETSYNYQVLGDGYPNMHRFHFDSHGTMHDDDSTDDGSTTTDTTTGTITA